MNTEIKLYLDWKGTYTKEKTVNNYRPWIKKFNDLIGKKIEDIDLEDIIKYSSFLKENYAPKSVTMGMTVMRNFLVFWKRRRVMDIIIEDIRVPKTRSNSHEPINSRDYVLMLAEIDVNDFAGARDNVIIRMLYDTGMRIGELCSLDASGVDLDMKYAVTETEKTDKTRMVFWGNDTNEFLKYYLEERKENTKEGERALFINLAGSRLTTRSSERIIQKYLILANIDKKIVPHSFRHGKAHAILDNGGTVKDVQYILGHQSPVSSFSYLNFNDVEQNKRAFSFLNK
jgi:site-specific recombinase XerD